MTYSWDANKCRVVAQVQQIEWHKGDVPVWGATFAIGLVVALAFLLQAAMNPKGANTLLVLACSVYASWGLVTAIRRALLTNPTKRSDVPTVT